MLQKKKHKNETKIGHKDLTMPNTDETLLGTKKMDEDLLNLFLESSVLRSQTKKSKFCYLQIYMCLQIKMKKKKKKKIIKKKKKKVLNFQCFVLALVIIFTF